MLDFTINQRRRGALNLFVVCLFRRGRRLGSDGQRRGDRCDRWGRGHRDRGGLDGRLEVIQRFAEEVMVGFADPG